jgi:hypothetical protein
MPTMVLGLLWGSQRKVRYMPQIRHRILLPAAILVASLSICLAVGRAAKRETVDVLLIGNSYTFVNSLPEMVQQISAAANDRRPIRCAMAAVGAATLESHWNDRNTRKMMRSRRWSIVVLQEQSLMPIGNPDSFMRCGGLLADEARSLGAKPLLYLTWARRSSPEQQDALTRAYRSIASAHSATVVPVGEAWRTVRRQRPNLELFQSDGSHPSIAGSYLAACVFYATITGKTPVGLPEAGGMRSEDALYLQKAAADAVKREKAWSASHSR